MGRPQIKYENVTEGSISTVEAVKGVGLMILKDDTIATEIKNYKFYYLLKWHSSKTVR